ncbi:hypothetical protein BDY19DRAFT_995822 [Irpex rosettiformis]|uniref:Uncharacterized protein n=1 Tax=Irpex rosettiformis TaxID=378272 RepID=A0ACB8TWS3_9APHY|nr:hypothetical protein BDY19DRAFT_995822 [Irpex rosettiformis]
MATARPVPPPITATDANPVLKHDDLHNLRRRFIGPMPERVVSQLEGPTSGLETKSFFSFLKRHRQADDTSDDNSVRDAIRRHALQFFIGHGGKEEDFTEAEERHIREQMYTRWKQSEWGQAHTRRREARSGGGNLRNWVGNSFDVGVFLGVDIINKHPPSRVLDPTATNGTASRVPMTRADTGADTFFTAPSRPMPPTETFSDLSASQLTDLSSSSSLSPKDINAVRPISADSSTPLLSVAQSKDKSISSIRKTCSELPYSPSAPSAGPSINYASTQGDRREVHYLTVPHDRKGKGKMVRYSPEILEQTSREETATPEPAPPEEVLARSGSAVEDTSAGAVQQAVTSSERDVIMRDRMMVQVSFTSDTLGPNFDSSKNRVTPHMQYEDYSEYLVVWRKQRLELYKNYSIPGEEWFTGHKQLAFLIPFRPTTKLSLYSFTDFTFAITCPTASFRTRSRTRTRYLLYGSRNGTNIFIFNNKSRTRATDWHWKLWRHLGNELPLSVEVRCPTLDARLQIDIPRDSLTDEATYAVFTPSNIKDLCIHVLRQAADYNEVIGRVIRDGGSFELAWRMDIRLDWIWQPNDLFGNKRDWSVLYGLAIKQSGQPAHLELRIQEHRATRLILKDGTRLDEPLGIEGYVERIRPNSSFKEALYLSTHDGYIFFLAPSQANPPSPPGPPDESLKLEDLRTAEAMRGARQILHAAHMSDLRDIVAVRRATQLVSQHIEQVNVKDTPEWEDEENFWENVASFDEDHEDPGGSEGLAKAGDKARLRVRRSFELLFVTGQVVKFEAYSCQHALEWISKLRPLISYWRKRHRIDARTEMNVVYASTGRPRVTPRMHHETGRESPPDAPPDPEVSSPQLSAYYSWCLLKNCRAISRIGKLYGHKELRGQYQHMQLILVAGHLVEYHTSRSSYLAALRLPEGQYSPDTPPLPRRYKDGLESDDLDEDTLFMVWWTTGGTSHKQIPENVLPGLNAKRNVSVYRTRSKLERDTWVFAIRAEIEKAVRVEREREVRLREAGGLVKRR